MYGTSSTTSPSSTSTRTGPASSACAGRRRGPQRTSPSVWWARAASPTRTAPTATSREQALRERAGVAQPYVQEHADLVACIQAGKPLNEGRQVAESCLTRHHGPDERLHRARAELGLVMNASKLDLTPPHMELKDLPPLEVAVPGRLRSSESRPACGAAPARLAPGGRRRPPGLGGRPLAPGHDSAEYVGETYAMASWRKALAGSFSRQLSRSSAATVRRLPRRLRPQSQPHTGRSAGLLSEEPDGGRLEFAKLLASGGETPYQWDTTVQACRRTPFCGSGSASPETTRSFCATESMRPTLAWSGSPRPDSTR